jgi:hypothetical protein
MLNKEFVIDDKQDSFPSHTTESILEFLQIYVLIQDTD